MGMIAFYAGLLMGVLVGIIFMALLSKLSDSEEVQEMPASCGELAAHPVELEIP